MSREQYLLPSAQRAARAVEKRKLILRFLREEIWADTANIGELLQVKPAAVSRTLQRLSEQGLVRSHQIPITGGNLTLHGITTHGQAMATEEGESVCEKVFSPSRVSSVYARHTLDIQLLRIGAERAGWHHWVNADRVEKWPAGQARPDAFVQDLLGRRVAVECERTIKSPKRYCDILNAWLQGIRRGEVNRVVWVSPDPRVRDRLRQIITSITHVEVAGQKIVIPRDRFENISFLTYSEWPSSCSIRAIRPPRAGRDMHAQRWRVRIFKFHVPHFGNGSKPDRAFPSRCALARR